jgi:tRNA(fMet)-specific endonuclease VapC
MRTYLEAQGRPIDPLDMLIASHALSLSATLVTNNVREFERVESLLVENWLN